MDIRTTLNPDVDAHVRAHLVFRALADPIRQGHAHALKDLLQQQR